jgi:Cu-Zn family superoxide dismutase
MKRILFLKLSFLIFPLGFLACAQKPVQKKSGEPVFYAVAEIRPTLGNKASGKVVFAEAFGTVKVDGAFTGLDKNSKHGFHIHEFGDCSAPDGASAGGHYNPEGHVHGDVTSEMHHAGDLGNIVTDAKGNGTVHMEVKNISVAGLLNPIVGRGVIIHKNPDDLISQPTGGAGPRIGCGVIGAAGQK